MAARRQELDEDFVKYLHYLMESERQKLRGAGVARPEREPSNWLMILEIVKKGVYHELAKPLRDDVSVSIVGMRMGMCAGDVGVEVMGCGGVGVALTCCTNYRWCTSSRASTRRTSATFWRAPTSSGALI